MHIFDQDIALTREDPCRFRGRISANWSVNGNPDGGYLIALAAHAMAQMSGKNETPIFTANFISRSVPGDAEISVDEIANSNQFNRYEAKVLQQGKEKVRVIGTFARRSNECFVERYETAAPELADLETCIGFPELQEYSLFSNVDLRLDPACAGWLQGTLTEQSEQRGWIRFKDDRAFDMLSIPLMADSFPPAVLASQGMVAWVPTIEFSINIRNLPRTRWLKCVFRTRFITCGLLEEDGELWDEEGHLVAICRQIAQYRKTVV